MIAGITLLAINWKAWNKTTVKRVRPFEWGMMVLLAFLSGVLGPTLFFLGLMLTPFIKVVLISTLDIPLTLLLGYLLLKEHPAKGTILGACLGVIGGDHFFSPSTTRGADVNENDNDQHRQ